MVWDHQEGYSTPQALDVLLKRLDSLGSRSIGTWSIDCETLYPTQPVCKCVRIFKNVKWKFFFGTVHEVTAVGNNAPPPRTAHLLHSSEYPKSTFLVLDNMSCLVADSSLDTIFSNLKSFFAPRKGLKIEVKGHYHEVQQYAVKFGSLLFGSTSKGVIVEVRGGDGVTCVSQRIRLIDVMMR